MATSPCLTPKTKMIVADWPKKKKKKNSIGTEEYMYQVPNKTLVHVHALYNQNPSRRCTKAGYKRPTSSLPVSCNGIWFHKCSDHLPGPDERYIPTPLTQVIIVVFLDDILIFSRTWQDHLEPIETILLKVRVCCRGSAVFRAPHQWTYRPVRRQSCLCNW